MSFFCVWCGFVLCWLGSYWVSASSFLFCESSAFVPVIHIIVKIVYLSSKRVFFLIFLSHASIRGISSRIYIEGRSNHEFEFWRMSLEKVGKMLNDSTKNQNKTYLGMENSKSRKEGGKRSRWINIFFCDFLCVFFRSFFKKAIYST